MPMQRRLPKRGFKSAALKYNAEVTLAELQTLGLAEVDLLALKQAGLVGDLIKTVKVIKTGELSAKVALKGIGATAGAKAAIEAAGGIASPSKQGRQSWQPTPPAQLAKSGKFGDLRRRLVFLLLALVVYRIGAHIPVPGIDPNAVAPALQQPGRRHPEPVQHVQRRRAVALHGALRWASCPTSRRRSSCS